MAESLTSKTVEFSSGVTGAIPVHSDSATSYLYPLVQLVPTELGGLSKYSFVAAASANSTSIKATAGQVYGYSLFHIDATPVYLKFYNMATAPTVGTDTPYLRFGIPYNGVAAANGTRAEEFWPMGIAFDTGIGIGVLATITDAGSGVLTASEVLVNIFYK